VEIAKRLGVEPCFVTPDWTLITGGSWADRWDVSVGSMTITPERMDPLYFSQPYYTTPAAFFVNSDNTTFSAAADLNGKKIGVCGGCTSESYLAKDLSIPGESIDFVVNDAGVTTYDTDTSALQDLALGDGVRLDAVLTAQPTGAQAISDGMPLKQLGDPVFFEYLAAAVDKSSSNDPVSFVKRLNEIIQEMHSDGTLKGFSETYFGSDLTSAAGAFDVNALGQLP
jgi:polar amino acid transport system substrate-binding protein